MQAMFTERLKTNGPVIKITRETTNNQSTETSIKVSLKIKQVYVLNLLPGIYFFQRSLKAFFYSHNYN